MQEKEKAAEVHRQSVAEYRKFLESCDFIKVFLKKCRNYSMAFSFLNIFMLLCHLQVNSQWRKIQDRLEDDERCLRLEKLDRLLMFQVYSFTYYSLFIYLFLGTIC